MGTLATSTRLTHTRVHPERMSTNYSKLNACTRSLQWHGRVEQRRFNVYDTETVYSTEILLYF